MQEAVARDPIGSETLIEAALKLISGRIHNLVWTRIHSWTRLFTLR